MPRRTLGTPTHTSGPARHMGLPPDCSLASPLYTCESRSSVIQALSQAQSQCRARNEPRLSEPQLSVCTMGLSQPSPCGVVREALGTVAATW